MRIKPKEGRRQVLIVELRSTIQKVVGMKDEWGCLESTCGSCRRELKVRSALKSRTKWLSSNDIALMTVSSYENWTTLYFEGGAVSVGTLGSNFSFHFT